MNQPAGTTRRLITVLQLDSTAAADVVAVVTAVARVASAGATAGVLGNLGYAHVQFISLAEPQLISTHDYTTIVPLIVNCQVCCCPRNVGKTPVTCGLSRLRRGVPDAVSLVPNPRS